MKAKREVADLQSVISKSPSVVTRKTGNEVVIVPVVNDIADMNSVYTLNETGAFIWELIDGKRTIQDLADALTSEYDTDRETANSDINSFIDEMKKFLIIK
jgi:hypothetical protein